MAGEGRTTTELNSDYNSDKTRVGYYNLQLGNLLLEYTVYLMQTCLSNSKVSILFSCAVLMYSNPFKCSSWAVSMIEDLAEAEESIKVLQPVFFNLITSHITRAMTSFLDLNTSTNFTLFVYYLKMNH